MKPFRTFCIITVALISLADCLLTWDCAFTGTGESLDDDVNPACLWLVNRHGWWALGFGKVVGIVVLIGIAYWRTIKEPLRTFICGAVAAVHILLSWWWAFTLGVYHAAEMIDTLADVGLVRL